MEERGFLRYIGNILSETVLSNFSDILVVDLDGAGINIGKA